MSWRWTGLQTKSREHAEEFRQELLAVIDRCHGNITEAAAVFGISRTIFYNYIKRHNLMPEVAGIKDKYAIARRTGRAAHPLVRGSQNEFEAMLTKSRKEAREVMRWTLQDAKGDYGKTAVLLGIRTNRLGGFIEALGLEKEAAALRAEKLEEIRASTVVPSFDEG